MDDFDDITCEEFYHDELERDHDEPYEPETDIDDGYITDNDYFDDVPF